MEALLLVSAALDCAAVAGIGWLVERGACERPRNPGEQRAALERLREDLARLVCDAEERAQGLAAALDAREKRLRALVAEAGRAEPAARGRTDPAEARLRRHLEASA